MQNKLLFLLVILLVITVQFISSESSDRKNSKTDNDANEVVPLITTKKKTSRVNDHKDHSSSDSSNRRDRLSKFSSSSNSHRSRSRGPSVYDDDDEWSPYGLAPSAYETGPYLTNGPTCFPLLDPQYPFFSDLCGAVPQARYALPNAFGHMERWQIAQVLGTILGPMSPASGNPVCTRSLRLLLCPLLFPPCPTKYEAPPVAPCQAFCRVVKTQCAAPGLELLPCDLLPPTSDLCPINPTPYSSLLSSFIPPPPLSGPMFPPGLPPGALSALLAQSAMASGFSPMGGLPPMGALPPSVLSAAGMLPPSAGILPPPTGTAVIGGPSPTGPPTPATGPISPPAASAPISALTPAPFPSVLPGVPFAQMMSPVDPSSSGLASMLAASGMSPMFPADPSSPLSSLLAQSAFTSGLSPAGFGPMLSPMNPLFGPQSLLGDSLTPILVDFPPLPFGGASLSPATSRFFPRLRSATTEQA